MSELFKLKTKKKKKSSHIPTNLFLQNCRFILVILSNLVKSPGVEPISPVFLIKKSIFKYNYRKINL